MPTLDPASVPDDAVERGAYVLQDVEDPQVILIGTGSELQVAVAAAELLKADGIRARVVSMPCEDHFAQQPGEYRDSVLPPSTRARVSVEAATTFGWHRWVGDLGETVGMEAWRIQALRPVRCYKFPGDHGRCGGRCRASLPEPRTVELKGLR